MGRRPVAQQQPIQAPVAAVVQQQPQAPPPQPPQQQQNQPPVNGLNPNAQRYALLSIIPLSLSLSLFS